jgi:hypothetical protein
MDPITSLTVDSIELIDGFTTVDFSFIKPAGTTGGYYLYISSTGTDFTYIDNKVDSSHYRDISISTYNDYYGYTHFLYTTTSTGLQGKFLYFYITALSPSLEESTSSGIVTTTTHPQQPENELGIYDAYDVTLSWDAIDFTNGRNLAFNNYNIYRSGVSELLNVTTIGTEDDGTQNILYNTYFTVGTVVWIFDIFKRSQWFGEVITEGELDLTDLKRTEYSDVSDTIILDNLRIFIDNGVNTLIGTTTSTGYIDTSFTFGNYYLYKITSYASNSVNSAYSVVPIFACTPSYAYPYLRSAYNSDTTLLSNEEWVEIKKTLIDKNYYDKTAYAIPYSATESFNIKGYLGISNFYVDVFLNGSENVEFTTSTGNYGEFEFYYLFPKGETTFTFQARDKATNTYFSRISGSTSIRTLYIYTFFSILGQQFKEFYDEMALQKQDISVELSRYASFTERYQPLIELYKIAEEDDALFKTLSYEVFKMFEYVAYDESLNIFLDALSAEEDNIDHYKIYYNNRLYRTARTGLTFTPRFIDRYSEVQTGVFRGKYYYGITSCTSTGEETTVGTLLVDDRYWPVYRKNNIIFWDHVSGANYYKIYKGTSEDELYYMDNSLTNVFVDIGIDSANTSITPPIANFTDYDPPTNIRHYIDWDYANFTMFFHNPNYLQIVIFAVGDNVIPEYQLDRITFFLDKLVPPELKYMIVIAYDSSLQVIYPGDLTIDLSSPPAATARYDISYYDGTEVYG